MQACYDLVYQALFVTTSLRHCPGVEPSTISAKSTMAFQQCPSTFKLCEHDCWLATGIVGLTSGTRLCEREAGGSMPMLSISLETLLPLDVLENFEIHT